MRGITWDHARGFDPLVATANEYHNLHPNVDISWEKRSLQQFGDSSIDLIAGKFDLLIIDHPFIGSATSKKHLVPLDEILPSSFLVEQQNETVGQSFNSYFFNGHQFALPIDAAAQVSAYRPDLMAASPTDWKRVVEEAERRQLTGEAMVGVPLLPTDVFCTFVSLCANYGEPPFGKEEVVTERTGIFVLNFLQHLAKFLHPSSIDSNPPQMLEKMASDNEIAYMPLGFGYSNYSRLGFRRNLILFSNVPSFSNQPRGACLGGTGLAISSCSNNIREAAEYAMWVTESNTQRTLYVESGGQPGNVVAWKDANANRLTNDFFTNTLKTLELAYVRPRFPRFAEAQSLMGQIIREYLIEAEEASLCLKKINELYANIRNNALST
ncbi:MAG: extracellular solute-binding protein [Nitrososphaerota archaeon]|nr:extracellular solute-binding protein [Nitrososphaerota archaeon]